MPEPVMTVAAECTYAVGDSTARASCNDVMLAVRYEHYGETCETSSELSCSDYDLI